MNNGIKSRVEWAVNHMRNTMEGYGDYFFKEFNKKVKKMKPEEKQPMVLCYICSIDNNHSYTREFYDHVCDLTVNFECCGEVAFLDALNEKNLNAKSFSLLMLKLYSDYITDHLLKQKEEVV